MKREALVILRATLMLIPGTGVVDGWPFGPYKKTIEDLHPNGAA